MVKTDKMYLFVSASVLHEGDEGWGERKAFLTPLPFCRLGQLVPRVLSELVTLPPPPVHGPMGVPELGDRRGQADPLDGLQRRLLYFHGVAVLRPRHFLQW
ncbi:hypothetical protein P3T76_015885 [Phytophthora citrophthora]|uniref:Uncharacterized protein n=1 Tax=Phytophthora citrophthora TaxID=4793 RepID=A0AAD9L9X3_9STRA|nr:hypothetical protein P3T76_015885 [Phytophthora citrophthora]